VSELADTGIQTPLPVTVVRPSSGWIRLGLIDIWRFRELLYFLVWRDLKIRYKQTLVGVLWVILQPVLTMIIFNFVFGRLAGLPSQGVPYPLFVFSGLLPWQLFASGLSASSLSIVSSSNVVSKVYFPRLLIPLAAVLGGVVDLLVALVVLFGLMAYYNFHPGIAFVTLPLFLLLAVAAAFGVGLWLSMLNVKYRDIQYTIPFLTQIWMFMTPVAYASLLIPPKFRLLYHLNPMATVVDGFRWALLGIKPEFGAPALGSLSMVVLIIFSGLIYFRRAEKTFADVI